MSLKTIISAKTNLNDLDLDLIFEKAKLGKMKRIVMDGKQKGDITTNKKYFKNCIMFQFGCREGHIKLFRNGMVQPGCTCYGFCERNLELVFEVLRKCNYDPKLL